MKLHEDLYDFSTVKLTKHGKSKDHKVSDLIKKHSQSKNIHLMLILLFEFIPKKYKTSRSLII